MELPFGWTWSNITKSEAHMKEFAVRNPTRAPTHPGELMREIIEEHARLPVTDVARRMGVSRQALHAVLRGRSAVSADMALRFAQLTGGRAELFLRMQENLDLWTARQRLGVHLARIAPVSSKRAA
jgi:addiction module HigA family antidote